MGTWKLGHIARVRFVKHVTLNSQNHTVNFQIIASNRNLPIGYTCIYSLHVLCMQSNMLQQLFCFKPGRVLENPNLAFNNIYSMFDCNNVFRGECMFERTKPRHLNDLILIDRMLADLGRETRVRFQLSLDH